MSKDIKFDKPLSGFDAQYVRDRPWLIRDAELRGEKVRFADDPDGDFEVEADEDEEAEEDETEEVEDYSGPEWTVKALTKEIDERNEGRDEDDEIVPDSAKKADLIDALLLDDEAQAEESEEEEPEE
jgi:hypothetical protein